MKLLGIFYIGGEILTIRNMLYDICDIFLPGEKPKNAIGNESKDVIIEKNLDFKVTPFKKTLEDLI